MEHRFYIVKRFLGKGVVRRHIPEGEEGLDDRGNILV
jgi:hypothetical protein